MVAVFEISIGGYRHFLASNTSERLKWQQASDICIAANATLFMRDRQSLETYQKLLRVHANRLRSDFSVWTSTCNNDSTACSALYIDQSHPKLDRYIAHRAVNDSYAPTIVLCTQGETINVSLHLNIHILVL